MNIPEPTRSFADYFLSLPPEERARRLDGLGPAGLEALRFTWEFWARPNQIAPPGSWRTWLILAGRGFGKTRSGAEWVRSRIRAGSEYVNLIGATASDARDIMVDGESGILAVCPKAERPTWQPSKARLEWPNGARSLIFTADEPDRLRGKQHSDLWADEIAAWRYPDSWDQAQMGLRLGADPRACVTTTPRPTALVKALISSPTTIVTRGSTYENRANLAPAFFSEILARYEGTRLGRQELLAEILEDTPGALWTQAAIDSARVHRAPDLRRVVVAVDPAVTSSEDSDETGIVVAGVGPCKCKGAEETHAFVLEDLSGRYTPDAWAQAAVKAYRRHKGDRIVPEVNNGGDLVVAAIRGVDQTVPVRPVRASRGKAVRAEPVAALYERGLVHHLGTLPGLEDQMTSWDPAGTGRSPDRVDALVWALTDLVVNARSPQIRTL